MDKDLYRFDSAYGKVYKYSKQHSAYLFLTTFLNAGIKPKQPEETKLRLIAKWEDKEFKRLMYYRVWPGQLSS